MVETVTIELRRGQAKEALGREVTFVGCSDVQYGGGVPADSALMFDVSEGGGDAERVTIVGESDWNVGHEAAGVVLRVKTAYAHRIHRVDVAVEPA